MEEKKTLKNNHFLEKFYRSKNFKIFCILIAIAVLASLMAPRFATQSNIFNILRQVSIYAIIAAGETILIICGMIDLSAGKVAALTGCLGVGAYLATQNLVVAMLVSMGVGAVTGLINGAIVTKFNVPPFIVTLAMTTAAEGLVLLYTHGQVMYNIGSISRLTSNIDFGFTQIPVSVVIVAAVSVIIAVVLGKTKFGRFMYAIGGNEDAAVASGVNVKFVKCGAFILNGAIVGLAGIVLMSRLNAGMPNAGDGYEFDAITGAIIGGTSFTGGKGTMSGTLIGIVIVGVINNVLNLLNVETYFHLIIKGVIIVTAVIIDLNARKRK